MLPPSSLVICSRERPKLLFETIQSVLQSAHVPNEIIIVDQSAEPHPALAALKTERPCEIRYIHSKSVGVGASRNLGIASARNKILIFIDDDMFVEPDWFSNLVQAVVRAGPCSVVTGQVLPGKSEVPGGTAPSVKRDLRPAVYRGRIGKDVLYTGNMGVYRSVFNEVGLFDERLGPGTTFPAAEDNDLGFRLLERGYCIYYVPDAIVYHRAWRSTSESLSLEWRYGVGRGAYYAKHMSWQDFYMLSRMVRDMKENVRKFLRNAVFKRQLNFEYLFMMFGIFYGAIRWRVIQMGKRSS
ncbi:MAG TPA: glycosyltransferase [Anaerolineales bacterium]|nr:glycosyltransferase [Anaerolineales bacterium]